MDNIMLDTSHSVSITRWLLRAVNSPVLNSYITEKPHTFAVFFSLLNDKVKWTKAFNSLIESAVEENAGDFSSEKYKEFNSRLLTMNPNLHSSENIVKKLWVGHVVYEKVKQNPAVFKRAISSLTKKLNNRNDIEKDKQEESKINDALAYAVKRNHINSGIKVLDESEEMDNTVEVPNYERLTQFHSHLMFFRGFLTMSLLGEEILEFSYLLHGSPELETFYGYITQEKYLSEVFFKTIFDSTDEDLAKTIGSEQSDPIFTSNLVSFDSARQSIMPLSKYWFDYFTVPVKDYSDLLRKIIEPVKSRYHSGALANLSKEDKDIVDHLLNHMDLNNRETNILLYSSNRIDKYNLINKILKEHHIFAYELARDIPVEDLKTACFIAQKFIAFQDKSAILVVNKTEKVLSKSRLSTRQMLFFEIEVEEDVEETDTEIQLLSHSGITTVWLAINPSNIHEDSLSRFTYSCEVKAASRAERREEIEEILKGFNLSDEFKHKLSQHVNLSRQQLINAVILSEKMCSPRIDYEKKEQFADAFKKSTSDPENDILYEVAKDFLKNTKTMTPNEKEKIILKAIEQSEKALNRKGRENLKSSITKYSLDYLNINSGFTIEQIINSLKIRPNSSMCFFGLPGTGKTQLAEYIAVAVDKPILIKSASDILGKYVGETEKAIKAIFDEAEETDSILLLDEGDSFLRDRSFARTSWEISMVNQLLQCMERFNGTFICATNLFDNLDIAALRRFTFKVEFMALTPEQKWSMFESELGDSMNELSVEEKEVMRLDLDLLSHLTPGDFAVVKRQESILGKKLAPSEWYRQLKFERDTKMKAIEKESKISMPEQMR